METKKPDSARIASREPKSELDELKERFLGLLLIKDGEAAPTGDGDAHLRTFVHEKDAPAISKSACHLFVPFRAKRIVYRTNRFNEITDVVFG
jgi:hypothetical protein